MTRAKPTTGKMIGFRLPIKDDAAFREKAAAAGLSPGEYARKVCREKISSF